MELFIYFQGAAGEGGEDCNLFKRVLKRSCLFSHLKGIHFSCGNGDGVGWVTQTLAPELTVFQLYGRASRVAFQATRRFDSRFLSSRFQESFDIQLITPGGN